MTNSDKPMKVFGAVEENALDQLKMVMEDHRAVAGALMADNHLGYCVPMDTEIYTDRGWLKWSEVVEGDRTIGLDSQTGLNVWTHVTEVLTGESEVVRIGHSRWSARVTPSHRWWVTKATWHRPRRRAATSLMETSKLNSETSLVLSRPFVGGDLSLSPEEAAVLGWLLCDGHISKDETGRANPFLAEANATIYQGKPIGRTKIEALLHSVPHSVSTRERSGTTWESAAYRLSSSYARSLWERAGLTTLTYAEMVCGLSHEARKAFLDAVIDAEGSHQRGYTYIAQNRGELHDAIALAIYLCGYMPREAASTRDCGLIGVGRRFPTGAFLSGESLGNQPVWCVTTEHGSWTMRQNRQIMLTGNSMPIGGVVAYKDAISPSGVGFDIACGNKAVRTELKLKEMWPESHFKNIDDPPTRAGGYVRPLMRTIQKTVSFGLGRTNNEPVDHELFDSPVWNEIDVEPGQPLKQKAAAQLGTVGSGNHYVDLLEDEEGFIWVANHFGSRGFGHTVATWFLAIAQGGKLGDRVPETETPAVLDIGTSGGDLYVEAMRLAGDYAYAGRDYVVGQVLKILGNPKVTFEVHNHHNFAWPENGLWVVRKGATPLTLEPAFIGGSMGDVSVIVRGKVTDNTIRDLGEETLWVEDIGALGSAPHGAGRVMSRTKAAGKLRKLWYCNNRNCDFEPFHQPDNATTPYDQNRCPKCGLPLRKGRMRDKTTAAINWDTVRADLTSRGIAVLGSGADEAPGVYKDLMTVIGAHTNIEVLHTLTPIGVVMAGDDVRDPYRD